MDREGFQVLRGRGRKGDLQLRRGNRERDFNNRSRLITHVPHTGPKLNVIAVDSIT